VILRAAPHTAGRACLTIDSAPRPCRRSSARRHPRVWRVIAYYTPCPGTNLLPLCGAGFRPVLFSTDSRLARYGCRSRSSARSCQAETILVPRMIRHRRGRTICGNANANVSSA